MTQTSEKPTRNVSTICRRRALWAPGLCAWGLITLSGLTAPNCFADPQEPQPPGQNQVTQAAADPSTPPNGIPHLTSPQNLPPGTTDTPVDAPGSAGLSYLQSVWHALQNNELNWRDALVLLAQRPMDPNAAPPPGVAASPQPPVASPTTLAP